MAAHRFGSKVWQQPSELHQTDRSTLLEARRTGELGLVHSWELVTAVDGPGTRMTLFLSGCPLRCLYCHNPDTMEMKSGTIESFEQVIAKIIRYRSVFAASGGGLTLSGGEPLFQLAFSRRILAEIHAAGIHTALDTSGFLGARLNDADLENIDLVLLDVKSGDEQTYQKITGQALAPTVEFGQRLHNLGKKMWIRFVLVPGLSDAPDNIANVARIVAKWRTSVARVEVLPFHNMGAEKWHKLGLNYELDEFLAPSEAQLAAARDIFREHGLVVY